MISTILTAGGSSSRFNGINKLLFKIDDKPVISHCVETFLNLRYIDEIIIPANISIIEDLVNLYKNNTEVKIIEGGETRQESVFKGLLACNNPDLVIIHDAARPFVSSDVIYKCLKKAYETSAAIAAVKTIDTVKIVADNGMIISTPERKTLWNAQTPQIFEYKKILELHKKYKDFNFTDDSCLFEKEGLPVAIVEGDYSNYKITTVSDVKM